MFSYLFVVPFHLSWASRFGQIKLVGWCGANEGDGGVVCMRLKKVGGSATPLGDYSQIGLGITHAPPAIIPFIGHKDFRK